MKCKVCEYEIANGMQEHLPETCIENLRRDREINRQWAIKNAHEWDKMSKKVEKLKKQNHHIIDQARRWKQREKAALTAYDVLDDGYRKFAQDITEQLAHNEAQIGRLRSALENCKKDIEHAMQHGTLRAFGAFGGDAGIKRPPIVCMCGSTKFKQAWVNENARLTLDGNIVLSVGMFAHADG